MKPLLRLNILRKVQPSETVTLTVRENTATRLCLTNAKGEVNFTWLYVPLILFRFKVCISLINLINKALLLKHQRFPEQI